MHYTNLKPWNNDEYQSFAYLGQFPSFDVVLAAANDDDYSDYS